MTDTLSNRREFLFLYDIRMGNPNGDPDENRPRRLPDGTFYVTDVRLKRFVRDWLKTQDMDILVDRPEDGATNLTGRLQHFLNLENTPESLKEDVEAYLALLKEKKPDKVAMGRQVVSIILKAFIDARLFGSSLAFKKADDFDIDPRPKTLTGAVQINMGEVLNKAQEVDIAGTSIFASSSEKTQGTFTTFFGLRYGLMAFNGIANEHSATQSKLTDDDYELLLKGLWKSVRSAPTANTRSKAGQVPRLLVDITFKQQADYQFGCLLDYVKVIANDGISETELSGPADYQLDCSRLIERLNSDLIDKVQVACHDDVQFSVPLPENWKRLNFDSMPAGK